jgi:hypothetical protein
MSHGGIVPVPNSWEGQLATRIQNQVDTIKSAFRRERNVTIVDVGDGEGGVAYMYAEGRLLVRDKYVKDVFEIFNPGQEVSRELVRRIVPGVSLLTQDERLPAQSRRTVRETLESVDQDLGRGIATPDHVFTVSPAAPCPATEPEQVYYGIEPYPSLCLENGGAGVLVYVADTGLLEDAEVDHRWLQGVTRAMDPGGTLQDWDPAGIHLDGTITIPPYCGHGTFVAGVIRGMAPQADIIVSNAFKVAGSQLESDLVAELEHALALGVDIFHLSIAATTRHDLSSLGFDGFFRRLRQYQGVVCVVAAGNNGSRKPCWPAASPGMVSVGALSADWRGRATFSNYGHWVRVYAPGRDLINAYATGPYECQDEPYKGQIRNFYGMAKWSGTSFSTPIVTGKVAARMSRTGETGKEAAAVLLDEARAHAIPGVGPVLLPSCDESARHSCRPCCHHAGSCGHHAGKCRHDADI